MSRKPSVAELAQRLRAEHGVSRELALSLAGWEIKVASNSDRLIQELESYFAPFVTQAKDPHLTINALEAPALDLGLDYTIKEPDPGKRKIKEEYAHLPDGRVVRKRLTGLVFAFGSDHHLVAGPCLDNHNQVVNFINNRLIQLELNRGCLLAHAAGVKLGQAGMALAGFSGAGKSTLALHLMSLGATFISNDRLLVRRQGGRPQMTGVPKLPRINPGTALNNPQLQGVMSPEEQERFAELDAEQIWDLEHKYDVDIVQCFGPGRFELQSSLDALTILNWQRDASEMVMKEVDLSQRPDLLGAFKKDWGLFFLCGQEGPDRSNEAYLRELKGVRVFELSGGVDFLGAAQRLRKELGWPK
ncbi:MAG: HprK-related kinase B [Thermodesulfobacteriota bacterium]